MWWFKFDKHGTKIADDICPRNKFETSNFLHHYCQPNSSKFIDWRIHSGLVLCLCYLRQGQEPRMDFAYRGHSISTLSTRCTFSSPLEHGKWVGARQGALWGRQSRARSTRYQGSWNSCTVQSIDFAANRYTTYKPFQDFRMLFSWDFYSMTLDCKHVNGCKMFQRTCAFSVALLVIWIRVVSK